MNNIKNYITKEMTKYGYISKKKGDKSSKGKKKGAKGDENNQENAENVESPPKKKGKKKKSSMINVDKKNDIKNIDVLAKNNLGTKLIALDLSTNKISSIEVFTLAEVNLKQALIELLNS